MYINNVTIVGRLTDKPKLKKSINNNFYVSFCVLLFKPAMLPKSVGMEHATKIPDPIPVECIAWGEIAEQISLYGEKNVEIVIEGSIDFKSYFDKEGINRTSNFIVCRRHMFVQYPYSALEKEWIKKHSLDLLKEPKKEARRERRKKIKEIERACEE